LTILNRFSIGRTKGSLHYKDDSEFTQSHPRAKPVLFSSALGMLHPYRRPLA
jgi:hypothetical protein